MSATCGFRGLLLLGVCVALLGACGDRRAPVPLDVSDEPVRGFKMLCNPVVPAGPLPVYQSIVEGLTVFCASRSSPRSR